MVFNEGLWSTYKKAVKKGVHLVSVLWIEECKIAQTIVSERLYPPFDMAKYESPNLFKRFRKVRSFQPDFEDMGEQKIKRRRKKFVSNVKENEPEIELPEALTYKKQIKVPDFLQNISNENGLVRTLLSVADIGPEYEEIVNRPSSPTPSEEEYFSIPLAVQLLRRILTPQSSPELSSSREEAADRLKVTPGTDGVSSAEGVDDIRETPKRQHGQDVKRRNRNLSYNFVRDENVVTGAEVGSADTEICNLNTERNNSSESSPESPTFGRSYEVPLGKHCKVPVKNNLLCNRASETKIDKPSMSSAELGTTTGNTDSIQKSDQKNEVQKGKKQKCNTVENIIIGNSNNGSSMLSEVSNLKIIEVCESQQVDTESLTAGLCSSQSLNKEDQFPNDVSSDTTVSKQTSVRKRKLLPLQQFNSPEVLDVSAVMDDSLLSVQCPYTAEGETIEQKQRKALLFAGETDAMELTPCVSSTSILKTQKHRQIHKEFDFSHNEKHGTDTVSKVAFSSRNSSHDFFTVSDMPKLKRKNKPQKMLERKLPSLVCTGLHRQ